MEFYTPKLVIILAFLFFPLISAHPQKPAPVAAPTTPCSKLVEQFCSRKEIADKKVFCLKLFESDPRSASAQDDLALFKIAMEQGIAKLTEIEKTFAPALKMMTGGTKTGIESCIDIFKEVTNTFNIYYLNIVKTGNKDLDSMSLSYDFDIAGQDVYNCHKTLVAAQTVIHDDTLIQQCDDVMDYFQVCYGITKIVAKVVV